MRNLLLATTAIAVLTLGAAQAQEAPLQPQNAPAANDATQTQKQAPEVSGQAGAATESQALGTTAGAATGAIAGAVVGGPIGAVIGGFAGAVIGAEAAVPEPAVQYVVANPVEQVTFDGGVSAGVVLPETVTLNAIPDYPEYAYVYADSRPVIVRMDNREVVYSPGYVLPEQTVTYIESNPTDAVTIDGELVVGTVVPDTVQLVAIPDNPRFSYVYVEDRPVLIENDSRTIVWVR